MAVHGFGVDAPRAADAPQVGEQPLDTRVVGVGEFVRFLETQTLKREPWANEALRDAIFGLVVGEDEDFNARVEQRWDNVALQEVDDCHAMVGGDEDFFGH